MATVDEWERTLRADLSAADLIAAFDDTGDAPAQASMTADDVLAALPSIRTEVVWELYGAVTMDELARKHAELHGYEVGTLKRDERHGNRNIVDAAGHSASSTVVLLTADSISETTGITGEVEIPVDATAISEYRISREDTLIVYAKKREV